MPIEQVGLKRSKKTRISSQKVGTAIGILNNNLPEFIFSVRWFGSLTIAGTFVRFTVLQRQRFERYLENFDYKSNFHSHLLVHMQSF